MKKAGILHECIQDRIIPASGGYLYAFANPTISGISKTKGACITSPINIAKQRKASSPWYLVNFIPLSICSTVKFE